MYSEIYAFPKSLELLLLHYRAALEGNNAGDGGAVRISVQPLVVSYYMEYQIPNHELGPYIHKMSARKQEASPVLVLKAPGFCWH